MLLSRNSGCKGRAFILIDKEFARFFYKALVFRAIVLPLSPRKR
ncbi:hypothetical protein SAMN05444350_14620 [Bacteroides stercorirosoris]|jgi:hypothetical protein|uniref:Uncharacterized protein n=1 Tax=Bacteroides stercorirosoris TaxID=871324 RepID=A0A1M6LBV4_9BACE|nr:hypothetical protein SAMN05444350_14620 [Bacteroides stercorirosoris]